MLSSLQAFAHHGGLYTHDYSAFGPVYFETFSTVFSWLPVTLDNGRMATLVVVLLTSLGFGVAIKMFTRNLLAGLATQIGIFVLLILSFVWESMHPSLVVSLLYAVALIAFALVARGQRSVGFMVLGATVAALVLTVVNVGVFAAIALLFTGLALAPPVWETRLSHVVGAALFVGTPFLLIMVAGRHSTDSWAVRYSLIVAIAAAGVVVVTLDHDVRGLVHGRDAYRFLLGGGVTGALIVVIALLSGTHPLDLVRGVFIDPAHNATFTIPLTQPGWTDAWGAVCLVGALLYCRYRNRSSPAGVIDACAHVGVGVAILYLALQQAQVSFTTTFTVALPLLFFAAIPPFGTTDSERIARVGLVALAVLEGLVAYPVAGAQVRWSSILIVPAGMLSLYDGMHQLRPDLALTRRLGRRAAAGLLASVVLAAGLGWFAYVFHNDLSIEKHTYYANTSVSLPGSDMIRLPAHQAETFESLSHAIRAQCSSFLAVPAINSLYFWTGETLPTDWFNVWFYTRDVPTQKQIVRRLEGQDRSWFCVVDSPTWTAFWAQGQVFPQLPLVRFMERFRHQNAPPELFGAYRIFVSHPAAS